MRIFGLTGNTGTGKTTVAKALRDRGVPVVDADRIAREIVEPDEPALEAIRQEFGDAYLDADGRLRRKALGRLVFGDPRARARLEAITHPRIAQRAQAEFQRYRGAGHSMAVYDSAILVETGLDRALAGLIVVTARRDQQIARIRARDGLSRADAEQRVDAQMSLADKVARADFVVDNSGPLDALEAQVDGVVAWMRQVVETA